MMQKRQLLVARLGGLAVSKLVVYEELVSIEEYTTPYYSHQPKGFIGLS